MATNSIIKRAAADNREHTDTRDRVSTEVRTWFEAYRLFLASPKESFGLKILPLALMGLVPLTLADDILLPFLGMIDNIPMAILVMFTAIRTWMQVRHYR